MQRDRAQKEAAYKVMEPHLPLMVKTAASPHPAVRRLSRRTRSKWLSHALLVQLSLGPCLHTFTVMCVSLPDLAVNVYHPAFIPRTLDETKKTLFARPSTCLIQLFISSLCTFPILPSSLNLNPNLRFTEDLDRFSQISLSLSLRGEHTRMFCTFPSVFLPSATFTSRFVVPGQIPKPTASRTLSPRFRRIVRVGIVGPHTHVVFFSVEHAPPTEPQDQHVHSSPRCLGPSFHPPTPFKSLSTIGLGWFGGFGPL
ncbi:hypothetical protein BXZ70DRAFT_662616 [Cristinia sonorae]|uniref:Uncharacterized protein n=1 Tax=Cristinia sonorae TaxID=1940300 RepID=A0A8K0XKI4_9AGAR|nr:hypothetical protein BXZ70DRAFT_662616 [Cristinia sonorae]